MPPACTAVRLSKTTSLMRVATTYTAVLAAIAVLPRALAVDVGSCVEFEAVDRKTETEVTITTADFQCDSYTRLSIRSEMVLKSTVGAVTFSNLALKVYGSLTVEPDVTFTGITDADHNGGALKLELGAVGVFQGTADFTDISIIPADTGVRRFVKGAAIHSKGTLTFEKDATFSRCYNQQVSGESFNEAGEEVYHGSSGGGGAVYHHAKGTMHFMGKLTMTDNDAYVYFDAGRGEGGGILNRGDVMVDGEANFTSNHGRDGGAIYQEKWATFVFNSFATFQENLAWNQYGGAFSNDGGSVAFLGGSLFDGNIAASTGDGGSGGALYNYDGGDMLLEGSTTFKNNRANRAAGIFNVVELTTFSDFEEDYGREYRPATITFPEDTVFEDNNANFCADIAYSFDRDTCGL